MFRCSMRWGAFFRALGLRVSFAMANRGAVDSDGEIVAYVRRDGTILSMPGWQSGKVSSVGVTRVEGTVELLGGQRRTGPSLEELLGEPDAPKCGPVSPKRELVSPIAPPGPPGLAPPPGVAPPPALPPPSGLPSASPTGLPATGSGKKRRKGRPVAVSEAPPGAPQAVF